MLEVTWPQVLAWRMARQSLAPRAATGPAEVVRRCAGIQAQVRSAAALGVTQRLRTPRVDAVDRALWRERSIVKTWAMRGTLHLLAADELPNVVGTLRSLHPWTAPSWERYHGVKAAEVEKVREAIGEVLEGRVLTREEMGAEVAERVRSKRVTQRLGSGWGELLKPAAYAGLLVQGPPKDGRVTYTRPDTWLRSWAEPDPVEAGAALVRSYLRAHGPATMKDVARWWARRPASTVKPWFERLRDELVEIGVEGRPHLLLAEDAPSLGRTRPNVEVRLLPVFDQYVIAAARAIDHLVPPQHRTKVFRTAGWISAAVVLGGRVVGTWSFERGEVVTDLWEDVPAPALRREIGRVVRTAGADAGEG